jgi:hypothetical protein
MAQSRPLDPAIPEREYFVRGREVLGKGLVVSSASS